MAINIVRLRPLTLEVRRLADLLELYLQHVHGLTTRVSPLEKGDESEVLHTDDYSSLRSELESIAKHKDPERIIDVDEG